MSLALENGELARLQRETVDRLQVITLSADRIAAWCAEMRLSPVLAEARREACVWQWACEFEHLESAAGRTEVAAWVRTADVLVVAADRDQDLPPTVRDWFEREWHPGPDRRTALVAVAVVRDACTAAWNSLDAFLAPLASRKGADYFAVQVASPGASTPGRQDHFDSL